MFTTVLAIICFFLTVKDVSSDSLLLLGDSVDRELVIEWCVLKNNQGVSSTTLAWGQKSLVYRNKKGRLAAFCCNTAVDKICFVHFFGSHATGPYANNLGNNSVDLYEGTQARLNLSISLYTSTFGRPDRVIFHTNLWDVNWHTNAYTKYFSNLEIALLGDDFRKNLLARIADILLLIDKKTDFGLRTAVWNRSGGELLTEFNRVTRTVAAEENLTLYDFDRDAWSTVHYDYSQHRNIFRDFIHPLYMYTSRAGEKMLGRQYSAAMTFHGTTKTSYSNHFEGPLSNASIVYLWHDIAMNATFYVNNGNRSRHAAPDEIFISALRLGPFDVQKFMGTSLYRITGLGAPAPSLVDRTVFNNTISNEVVHYYPGKFRPIDIDVAIAVGGAVDNIIQLDAANSFWLKSIYFDYPVSKVYLRKTDYLLQRRYEKEIYYVRNATRYFVPNADFLTTINMTFEDVVWISNEQDIGVLPLSKVLHPTS